MNGVASNQPSQAFPPHYVDLKKEITKGNEEAIVASWKTLLEELAIRTKVCSVFAAHLSVRSAEGLMVDQAIEERGSDVCVGWSLRLNA